MAHAVGLLDSEVSSTQSSPRVRTLRRTLSDTIQQPQAQEPLFVPLTKVEKRRLRGAGQRSWIRVDRSGESSIVYLNKQAIQHQLGVQVRDLRLLDPQLATSYPSAILARDKALVVNLEHIRCIITMDAVLVKNSESEFVVSFIEALRRHLPAQLHLAPSGKAEANGDPGAAGAPGVKPGLQRSTSSPDLSVAPAPVTTVGVTASEQMLVTCADEQLPFELQALEVILDLVCTEMERLAGNLESGIFAQLEDVTSKVSSINLERMRQNKTRLVRLKTRVETIREVLRKFMEDDSDMRNMNLTANEKERQRQEKETELARTLSVMHAFMPTSLRQDPFSLFGAGKPASSSGSSDSDDDSEVQEVEMLLETHFLSIDNTYNKLQTMNEYIDDTEDYIKLEFNIFRNRVIKYRLLLNIGSFFGAVSFATFNFFGMNLNDESQSSYVKFVVVSVVSSAASMLGTVAFLLLLWWRKLLHS